jgi:hypothetical protein
MIRQESQNAGGGPLTRTELAIVLVVVAILGLIITSTLARAARRSGNAQEPGRQQPIPAFAPPPQAGGSQRFATSPIVGSSVSLPLMLPGGLSNTPNDSFIFSGITNSEPADWLRSLESGPVPNTGQ